MTLGPWSILLLLGAVNGLLLAIPLWRQGRNRPANRALAALIVVAALQLMPYVLGYAGAYDTWRWLTFAPFSLTLLFGPLLWGYTVALTTGALPPRFGRHLIPGAVQFAYNAVCFALPMDAKWDWYTGGHRSWVDPLLLDATFISLVSYLALSARQYGRYRRWLDDHLSNTEDVRRSWLGYMLLAFGVTVAIALAFALTGLLVRPLNYLDRFPVMVSLALLTYFLGLAGWRDAERVMPTEAMVVERADEGTGTDTAPAPARMDYGQLASEWTALIESRGWVRNPGLTREGLAALLGTSPRTLSRVLNLGRGETFHQFVNNLRVELVKAALLRNEAGDLLPMALEAGFASKASFNRVFKAATGLTPTAWREGQGRSGEAEIESQLVPRGGERRT